MRFMVLTAIGVLALSSCIAEFPHTPRPSATTSLGPITFPPARTQTPTPIVSKSPTPSSTATRLPLSPTPAVFATLPAGEYLVYGEYLADPRDPYLQQFKLAPVEDLAAARMLPIGYRGTMAQDGRRFAFFNAEGAWIYDLTTAQATRIDLHEDGEAIQWNSCTAPTWSPSGSRFLANCRTMDHFDHMILVDFIPSTAVARIVPGTEGCQLPTFSPIDTIVVAECRAPSGPNQTADGLLIINIESGNQQALPGCESITCNSPVWSPIGEYLAVWRFAAGMGELENWEGLYLVPAECYWKGTPCEGSALGPIARPHQYAWAPDGGRLALEEDAGTLKVFDLRHRTSITYGGSLRIFSSLIWSPSGQWIAVSEGSSSNLLILDSTLTRSESVIAEDGSLSPSSWIWVR